MLQNTKLKSGRCIDFSKFGGNLPSTSMTTLAASEEKNATNLLAPQANVCYPTSCHSLTY